MTGRGKYSKYHDWDPMREDYDDKNYDQQYPDDEVNGEVQLDHCKLYIKNIPKALTEDGLRAVFEKYATNVKVFLSRDPLKRYSIAKFETPGEAKLCMMKLNKTEPLNLIISVAHKKKYHDFHNPRQSYPASQRDRSESGSSRGLNNRKHEELVESNDLEESIDDVDLGLDDGFDTESELEQVNLKLKYLELKAEQIKCKQRIILLNKTGKKSTQKPLSTRCILPDGRIVVKNDNERPSDNGFSSAAGDSSLPALQRHVCITCGSPADSYCGRCGVAPYCGQKCQLEDWHKRHRAVCHNLSRGKNGTELAPDKPEPEPVKQPSPVALRQPASICNQNQQMKRDDMREDVNNSDRPKRNFHPPSQKVNRNPNFKNYNNLRRPKFVNEKQNVQDEEESFEIPDTKPKEPVQPPSKPVEENKPVNHEPSRPKPAMTPPVKVEVKVPSAGDTASVKNVVPKHYMVETLREGDTVLLSADAAAAACRGGAGLVCLALHAASAAQYDELCSDYGVECERDGDTYAPRPGELFSYRDPADEAWYRARRVSPTLAALIDAARVATFSSPGSEAVGRCARISDKYAEIPEFCCVLEAEDVKIGDSLKCTITSKIGDKCKVSVEKVETGAVTEGVISRWRPRVEGLDTPAIPEVERPPIKNNMKAYLVTCTSFDRVILRPSDIDSCKEFDAIQEDVLLYAKSASPLKQPPQKGDVVIAKFTDGLWYRALCKRTNIAQNKYQLEFLEYGNIEISTKENLYPCPAALRPPARPSPALRARLAPAAAAAPALAPPAARYLRALSDDQVELAVTLVDGSSSAPSGAEVNLHVVKTNESVNKKLVELSTPEWKKLEERGGDVIETPHLMLGDIAYMELPRDGCDLDVFIDLDVLKSGSVSARPRKSDLETKLEELTKRMEEYCNSSLGKDPYLPKVEELCIALCPPYPQWFRAVLCEQVGGAGGPLLRVCYLDYGNLDTVPVASVRKMLPEFAEALPALALHVDIRGMPKNPSNEMLAKAFLFMDGDEEGRGRLRVRNCKCVGLGMYEADAPELLAALGV